MQINDKKVAQLFEIRQNKLMDIENNIKLIATSHFKARSAQRKVRIDLDIVRQVLAGAKNGEYFLTQQGGVFVPVVVKGNKAILKTIVVNPDKDVRKLAIRDHAKVIAL